MQAEIDQSGKLEQLNTHTVIGLSNDIKISLYITSSEKIKLTKVLRKSVIAKRKDQNALLFSVFIFVLLIKMKKTVGTIFIDIEYTGKNNLIQNTLERLSSNYGFENLPNIRFKLIGISSRAHELVYKIYIKKDKKNSIIIKSEDIIKFLKI